jgi:hypothetical protein
MNRELTDYEKSLYERSQKANPYHAECPNRHLWSEGYCTGFNALSLLKEDNRTEEKADKPTTEEYEENILSMGERIKELEVALRDSLHMMEQTLVYRNANGLKFGNTFLESAIEQAKSLLSK